MKDIAKLTSYGVYLDTEAFSLSRYPNDEDTHIVGPLADYVYDLEMELKRTKEQLKNVLTPRFKIFDEVFVVDFEYINHKKIYQIHEGYINTIICTPEKPGQNDFYYRINTLFGFIPENRLCTTKEEAEKKLKQLSAKKCKK